MRNPAPFIALLVFAFVPGFAHADITRHEAQSICYGKAKLVNGGCAWCDGRRCFSVNCDSESCSVTILEPDARRVRGVRIPEDAPNLTVTTPVQPP